MGSLFSFLGSGGDNGAGAMRKLQKQQQGQISLDTAKTDSIFNSFSPGFYQKAMQVFQNQQMPGVEQGFQTAQKGLGYNLARRGLTKSSSAEQLGQGLAKSVNVDKQNVVNSARGEVNTLKDNQGKQQAGLIQESSSANSPSSVAQNALGTAGEFQAPGWFEGIGKTIGNWANVYLANQNKNVWGNIGKDNGNYGGSFAATNPSPFGMTGGFAAPTENMGSVLNVLN